MKSTVLNAVLGIQGATVDRRGYTRVNDILARRADADLPAPGNYQEWIESHPDKIEYAKYYPEAPVRVLLEFLCTDRDTQKEILSQAIVAMERCQPYDFQAVYMDTSPDKGARLLMIYFGRKIDISPYTQTIPQVDYPTIAEMVEAVMEDRPIDDLMVKDMIRVLASKHVKVDRKHRAVYLYSNGKTISKVLSNPLINRSGIMTCAEYRKAILDIKGVARSKSPVRIGGEMQRALYIPIAALFPSAEDQLAYEFEQEDDIFR